MIQCWMCQSNSGVEENTYGDFPCQNCGVLVSNYDPNIKPTTPTTEPTSYDDYINQKAEQKEEEMDLKNWSKDNAKFIKIKSGESYEGKYLGSKAGVNMNGEPAVIYNFDGKEFKSSSTVLADAFSEIAEGTKIKLSRIGEGLQTKWTVETL